MARLYTKKVWLNDQTKLSAKNLNHIEKGIEAVAEAVENKLETFNGSNYYEYDLTKFNDIMTVADNGAMVGSITEESNIVSELMKVANNCGVLKEVIFDSQENCNFKKYWINIKEALNKKDEIRRR